MSNSSFSDVIDQEAMKAPCSMPPEVSSWLRYFFKTVVDFNEKLMFCDSSNTVKT